MTSPTRMVKGGSPGRRGRGPGSCARGRRRFSPRAGGEQAAATAAAGLTGGDVGGRAAVGCAAAARVGQGVGRVGEVRGVAPLAPEPVRAPRLPGRHPHVRCGRRGGGGAARGGGGGGGAGSAVRSGVALLLEMDRVLPGALGPVLAPRLPLRNPVVVCGLG